MSRRENTVNVLLGSLLLFSLAAPFLALWLAVYLLELLVIRFFPGLKIHQDIILAAILAGSLLTEMISALRRYRWRKAFLGFAFISAFLIVFANDLRLGNGLDMYWFVLTVVFFSNMPKESPHREDIGRGQFFLGVTTVSALFAAEAKLFGTGFLGQIVSESVHIAIFVLAAIYFRKFWQENNNGSEHSPASAAG